MLYIDSGISGIFIFALLSIPGNLTIPWWSLCEHSTNLCKVNLLPVVAIKIICGCFSQPLYFNSAVTRFVIRTFLLSSCVFRVIDKKELSRLVFIYSKLHSQQNHGLTDRGPIFVMMPTVQGIETLCRPHLPILFRTTLIPRSILQLVMTVILGSNYDGKTFSTLCSTV